MWKVQFVLASHPIDNERAQNENELENKTQTHSDSVCISIEFNRMFLLDLIKFKRKTLSSSRNDTDYS